MQTMKRRGKPDECVRLDNTAKPRRPPQTPCGGLRLRFTLGGRASLWRWYLQPPPPPRPPPPACQAEVLPPVCSMRFAIGHRAPVPDLTVRKLANTIFKMVRQLCHISQAELTWVRDEWLGGWVAGWVRAWRLDAWRLDAWRLDAWVGG